MEAYVPEGSQLIGIKETLENALRANYSFGIIKKREFDRNMNKVKNILVPELCDRYGMTGAISKLEEIRDGVEGGCSFDNCYIRAVDPERVKKINEGLNEFASVIVSATLAIQRRERQQDRKYLDECVSENCVRLIENC